MDSKSEYSGFKLTKPHEVAYVLNAIVLKLDMIKDKIEDKVEFKEVMINYFHKLVDKYLDQTAQFIELQTGKMKKKVSLNDYLLKYSWKYFDEDRKQMLILRIFSENITVNSFMPVIYNSINPENQELYPYIKQKTLNNFTLGNKFAFIALSKFKRSEDIKLILSMVMKGKNEVLFCIPNNEQVSQDQIECQIALCIIHRVPHSSYFEELIVLWQENVDKYFEFLEQNPDDPNTSIGFNLQESIQLLMKAIIAYKTNSSLELITKFISEPAKNTVAWKNFDVRRMTWLVESLSSIDDDTCFYFDLMKLTALKGRISLKLIKRVCRFSYSVGLSWMCDLSHPIVKPSYDDSLIKIEESSPKKIKYVLEEITKNDVEGKIDIMCYYITAANLDTCNIVNSFAIKFPDSPKLIKALLWVLRHKTHGLLTSEALKALYAFNQPSIDEKVKKILDKKLTDNPQFDKGGELATLMEKKPRFYKTKSQPTSEGSLVSRSLQNLMKILNK